MVSPRREPGKSPMRFPCWTSNDEDGTWVAILGGSKSGQDPV